MKIIQPIIHKVLGSGLHKETRLDDKSFELLLEIQKVLSVFEPIGDDEVRKIWLEIPRGTAEEWKAFDDEMCDYSDDEDDDLQSYQKTLDEYYPREIEWFYLATSTYRGNTFLNISDRCREYVIMTNRDIERNGYAYDMTWLLNPLLELVKTRVAEIVKSPEAYYQHIEAARPYRQRSGKIRSRDLNAIIKVKQIDIGDKEKAISIMKELIRRKEVYETAKDISDLPSDYWNQNGVPDPFETMTIRLFCKYYRIADTLFWSDSESELFKKRSEIQDDVEYYVDYGIHKKLDDYDLDSVQDFKKFAKDHYGELGFSRMNVGSTNYYTNGKWLLTFGISYSAYVDVGLKIAIALFESGAPFIYYDAETTLHVLEETGWVRLEPHTFHDYLQGGEDEGVFPLPYVEFCDGENEISREQFNQIVEKAVWEQDAKLVLDKVIPLESGIYELVRDEVDNPMTVSQVRKLIEQKFKTYLSVERDDETGEYYYMPPRRDGEYVSEDKERKYYATFNEAMSALMLKFNEIYRQQ